MFKSIRLLIVLCVVFSAVALGFSDISAQDDQKHLQLIDANNIFFIEPIMSVGWPAAVTSDGQLVASVEEDGAITVREVTTGNSILSLAADVLYPATDVDLFFGSDDRWLVFCGWGTAIIWDVETGDVLSELSSNDSLSSCQLSPDNHFLAADSFDSLYLWEITTGELIYSLDIDDSPSPYGSGFTFNPDGSQIVTFLGQNVKLWDVETGQEIMEHQIDDLIWYISFSPDGEWMVIDGDDTKAYTKNIGEELELISVEDVDFSPDGHWMVVSHGNTIEMEDLTTAGDTSQPLVLDIHATGVHFSDDSQYLFIYNDFLSCWDVNNWEESIWTIDNDGYFGGASPDGDLFLNRAYVEIGAAGTPVYSFEIWDTATGQMLYQLDDTATGPVDFAYFDGGGNLFITLHDVSGFSYTAQLWGVIAESTPTIIDEQPIATIESLDGVANEQISVRTEAGNLCEIQQGDNILAVGYAEDSRMIAVYTSGIGCEGLTWLPMREATTISWSLGMDQGLETIQLLSPTSAPTTAAGGSEPLSGDDVPYDLCENASEYSNASIGIPPYQAAFRDVSYRDIPPQFLATSTDQVDIAVCGKFVDTLLQTCSYTGGYEFRRNRTDIQVTLVNWENGSIIAQRTFLGEPPEACPAQRTFSNKTETATGTLIAASEQIPGWIIPYLEGNAITRTIVNTGSINVRSEPNTASEILG